MLLLLLLLLVVVVVVVVEMIITAFHDRMENNQITRRLITSNSTIEPV